MKPSFLLLVLSSCFIQRANSQSSSDPVLIAPAIVSTSYYERDYAISPDGNELYYSLVVDDRHARIIMRKKEGASWSLPQALPFSTTFFDIEPAFSPDGRKLFFVSNRSGNFDIYVCKRLPDDSWTEPMNLGMPVNTTANEYYPSVTEDGTLYFTARYEGGIGGEDIWSARWNGTGYDTPQVLPEGVNTKQDEYNAFINPKGEYILLGSYGRSDDTGRGDIYRNKRDPSGNWRPAEHLEDGVNSSAIDYCPYVSSDGKYLYFTSERALSFARSQNPFRVKEVLTSLATPVAGGNIFRVPFPK